MIGLLAVAFFIGMSAVGAWFEERYRRLTGKDYPWWP